ncbi:hypothetical protein EDC04DRAFT_2703990 [Pisolithus marmoratus]|nr:hypothetical protein EDC04DRAFT_2703990 [Pisolithus marmoratus]
MSDGRHIIWSHLSHQILTSHREKPPKKDVCIATWKSKPRHHAVYVALALGSSNTAYDHGHYVVVVIDMSSGRCSSRVGTTGRRVLGNTVSWGAVIKIDIWLLVPPRQTKDSREDSRSLSGRSLRTAALNKRGLFGPLLYQVLDCSQWISNQFLLVIMS